MKFGAAHLGLLTATERQTQEPAAGCGLRRAMSEAREKEALGERQETLFTTSQCWWAFFSFAQAALASDSVIGAERTSEDFDFPLGGTTTTS